MNSKHILARIFLSVESLSRFSTAGPTRYFWNFNILKVRSIGVQQCSSHVWGTKVMKNNYRFDLSITDNGL